MVDIIETLSSLSSNARRYETSSISGTPPYMSPEQLAGLALGPPSDVWALAALLYEAPCCGC